jgi:hypothetical protein
LLLLFDLQHTLKNFEMLSLHGARIQSNNISFLSLHSKQYSIDSNHSSHLIESPLCFMQHHLI